MNKVVSELEMDTGAGFRWENVSSNRTMSRVVSELGMSTGAGFRWEKVQL